MTASIIFHIIRFKVNKVAPKRGGNFMPCWDACYFLRQPYRRGANQRSLTDINGV